MVSFKKIAVFSALSMSVAMYGGPDDEWKVVGARKKGITPTPASHSKSTRSLASTSSGSLRATKIMKIHNRFDVSAPSSVAKILSNKPTDYPSKLKVSAPITPAVYDHKPIKNVIAAPKIEQSIEQSFEQPIDMRLHMAALNNDITRINHLIMTDKVDICAQDTKGATALHWAAVNEKTAAIKTILNYDDGITCIGIQDENGKTPLHLAAGRMPAAMLALLEKAPLKYIDLEDNDGSTPLLWATSGGKLETVKALIKKGAYINAQDAVRGRTALHWALRMRKGATEKGGTLMPPKTSQAIIKHLVEHKADTTLKDYEGYTPMYWAKQLDLPIEIALLNNMPPDVCRSAKIRSRKQAK